MKFNYTRVLELSEKYRLFITKDKDGYIGLSKLKDGTIERMGFIGESTFEKLSKENYLKSYNGDNCYEVLKWLHVNPYHIVKLQAADMSLFEAEDENYPDGRAIAAKNRAIEHWLNKMTDNEELQSKIYAVITRNRFNMSDPTFKPITEGCREIGVIIDWSKEEK